MNDESNKPAASADKRGHGEKQGDIKTGGRTGREIRRCYLPEALARRR